MKSLVCTSAGAACWASSALLAQLKLMFVGLGHCLSVQARQVPLIRELDSLLRRAAVLAIAAKDAGIVAERDRAQGPIPLDLIDLGQGLGRADVNACSTAHTQIRIEFRLASIPLGHHTRRGRKTRRISRPLSVLAVSGNARPRSFRTESLVLTFQDWPRLYCSAYLSTTVLSHSATPDA